MSAVVEGLLKEVLTNQAKQDIKLVRMEERMESITIRGCVPGDEMVDKLTESVKKDIADIRKTSDNKIKDVHKRVDKFKIAAFAMSIIAVVLGLKGYS